MLKEEFRRAFFSWSFLLAIAITFASTIVALLEYGPPVSRFCNPAEYPFINNAFDAFIYGAYYWVLPAIAPLIAVLPFAASLITDRSSGYVTFILSRTSFRKYITSKFFANLLAGGISISIPLLIIYGVINIFYPRGFPPVPAPGEAWVNVRIPYVSLPGPMGYLYLTKTDLYVFFLIGLSFIFGATYASLGLALSLFLHNKYVALATPFVLYMIGGMVADMLGKSAWNPTNTLMPFFCHTTSWLSLFGELGAIFLISVVCLFMFAKKKRVYE
ncbi:MAG: hypothetical protein ACP5SP_07480 [Caldisericum sp.]|uniref:hypothetical protein n=1 Tax=Caldisericum sp. TaxID=2499687 RepID=UPI003D147CB4